MAESVKLVPKGADAIENSHQLLYCYQCAQKFIHNPEYNDRLGQHDGVVYEHKGHVIYVYRTETLVVSKVDAKP